MRIFLNVVLIALLASATAHAGEHTGARDNEIFQQICVLLDLDDEATEKLAVAFETLGDDLDAAAAGAVRKGAVAREILDDFEAARGAFRDSVGTFLTKEQFNSMMNYSSAIVYELTEGIAHTRVVKYKKSLNLSDDQITALTLVVNEELRSVVETVLIYGEGEVDNAVAAAMGESLLEIRENAETHAKEILTEDQWSAFQKMRGKA